MPKKSGISDQEIALFRETIRGTKRLTNTKKDIEPPITKPIKINHNQSVAESAEDLFSDYETVPPVGRDELLDFSLPGVQHKTLRNLRNGKYNMEATLDLHGQTVVEARTSLSQFLSFCQEKGKRYVLIIHGKGRHDSKPILKNKLNNWLRQSDQVLAFCSASIKDGRTGSLYVLLKRRN